MRELSQIQQLTLFTEDSLADVSPSAWQESNKGKQTNDIYGRSFRAWSESLNRVGSSVKTYLEYCVSRLTMFAPTWSVKATKSGYGILKLRLSERCTDGSEYFLLRTPDAHCDRGFRKPETFKERMNKGLPLQLNDQIAHLLPTPVANDAKNNNNPSRQNRHTASLDVIAGGGLNPEWVEALMGFPISWTEV